jgi:hypothetical protein
MGLDLCFCWLQKGFGDRAFLVSLLKSVTLAFECLVVEIWYEVGPSLLLAVKRFRDWVFHVSLLKSITLAFERLVIKNSIRGGTFAFVGCKKVLVIGRSLYHY